MAKFDLNVNGKVRSVEAPPDTNLLEVLREDFGLTGTKYGCGEGQCGACTVNLNGLPVRACVTPLSSIKTKAILTIEGLEKDGKLHALQEAFIAEDAMQCGYCTSGMIMAAHALLRRTPKPTEAEIVTAMDGNICRCCSYPRIVAAIKRASQSTEVGE